MNIERIQSFTDLHAWQEGHQLVLVVYRATQSFPKEEVFGVTAQLRRAIVSVTSNIAEGFSRRSYREKAQLFSIALGSLTEAQNQLLIARDLGYLPREEFQHIAEQAIGTHKLLNALIRTTRTRIPDSKFQIPDSRQGFSLLELLVALGIASLIVVTVLGLMGRGLDVLRREEHRRVALGIAEERIELLRNVPYDDLGTVGGIPNGPFLQQEIVERNGARYTVATRIRAIDDALDNTAPNDAVPTDYRELAVDVSWGLNPNQTVTIATLAAPPGTEQATATGMLRLRVTDARGGPVEGAFVQLANSEVSPPIALTLPTDADGIVALPGAPPSNGGYHVRVTRAGYSVDETIAPSAQNPNPNNPPLTVLAHEVTNANFAIDRLATIALTFQKYKDGKPFRDLTTFTLQGMKTIGSSPNPNPPPDTLAVYKAAPQSFTTDQGAITISNLEWDTYRFTETMPDVDLAVADPLLPIELLPGTTQAVTIAFEPHRDHTLRVIVRDASGGPVSSASVQLEEVDPPQHTDTGTTPTHGQIFFSPLRAGAATLTVSHPNFATATRELTIGGTMEVEVRMEPL